MIMTLKKPSLVRIIAIFLGVGLYADSTIQTFVPGQLVINPPHILLHIFSASVFIVAALFSPQNKLGLILGLFGIGYLALGIANHIFTPNGGMILGLKCSSDARILHSLIGMITLMMSFRLKLNREHSRAE